MSQKDGGYDDGYGKCSCFWGTEPSSYVRQLVAVLGTVAGRRVLDAGCGEGKNAAFMHSLGAIVTGIEISLLAITNARNTWTHVPETVWRSADIREVAFAPAEFEIVIAYGLLHCLHDPTEVREVVSKLQHATAAGGYNVVCVFNDRFQDLRAHPDFRPCLLSHREYCEQYQDWRLVAASDEDLVEVHPHNSIEHTHSMTRIIAEKRK